MKKLFISTLFCNMLIFPACNNASKNAIPNTATPKIADSLAPEKKPTMVGGDRDEHDCIGSAGYQWSEVRKECVRLFEKGVRLNPVDASLNQSVSAFIILSEDQSKAELFLPDSNKSKILIQNEKTKTVWELDMYRLTAEKAGYILEDKNQKKILYKK
jgi:hypothetical protein